MATGDSATFATATIGTVGEAVKIGDVGSGGFAGLGHSLETGANAGFQQNASGTVKILSGSSHIYLQTNGGATGIMVNSAGNIGIKTTGIGKDLDVNGVARFREYIQIADPVTLPSTNAGYASIWVEGSDVLKITFGSGTTKTFTLT